MTLAHPDSGPKLARRLGLADAVVLVVAIYAVTGAAALAAVGPTGLANSTAPLAAATQSGTLSWLTPAVRVGGALASAGALLSTPATKCPTALRSCSAPPSPPSWQPPICATPSASPASPS